MSPTYEYGCQECGTYGSTHRSMDQEDAGMSCPKCKIPMVRIYSPVGVVFKGDGWAGKSK
jgi:putative FmdB family regulatory protein